MQVSIEETSAIGRRLTINVPVEKVQAEIDKGMQEEFRHRRLDGFRAGKVPKQVIQRKFGAQIRQKAIGKLIETSLPEALQKEKLEPAGRPEIEKIDANEEEKDLVYTVNFEVFPVIELPDLSKFTIDKQEVKVTDADVEKSLQDLRHQSADWNAVERKAKKGDRLTIDYSSTMNGKPYENSSNQNVFIELGADLFIHGFETGLVGAAAGETRELDLNFPSDWRIEKLAGKPVHFTVDVKEVSEKQDVPLDDDFAKKVGAENAELSSIQQKIRENLTEHMNYLSGEHLKKQLLDKLLDACDIPLPKALVDREISLMHEDLHRKEGSKAAHTCEHEGLEESAQKRVALSLVFRKIVELENLKPDDEKVKAKISEIGKSYGNAEFVENMYYESEELLLGIRNTVLVDQAIDSLISKVVTKPKTATVKELLEQHREQH